MDIHTLNQWISSINCSNTLVPVLTPILNTTFCSTGRSQALYSTKLPYTNVPDDPATDQDARRLFVEDVTLHDQRKLPCDRAGSRGVRDCCTLRGCDSFSRCCAIATGFHDVRDCCTLRDCDSFSRCAARLRQASRCARLRWSSCRGVFDKGGPIPLPTTNMRKHGQGEHTMEHEHEDTAWETIGIVEVVVRSDAGVSEVGFVRFTYPDDLDSKQALLWCIEAS